MHLLTSIKIENFKSFTNEVVGFDNVACFVGANESGKSNLLDAIYHLSSKKQAAPFTPDDLCIGAPNYPIGEVKITYTLLLKELIVKDILEYFPKIKGKFLSLTKRGKPNESPVWECSSDITQSVLPDIIQINNKNIFVQNFNKDEAQKKTAKKRSDCGWFINDSTVDLRKNPYKKLLDENKITLLKGKEKIDFVSNLVKDSALKNMKIYQWRYKEEDFLQENVPIADLIQSPDKFRSVTNMFLISGWKKSDLATNLQNQTSTVYSNLFNQVKRSINSLIKNHWSSHKNLKIELEHRGDHLTIHLNEPGSSTPPEFRSDGLKWFLTFLINFRAQSKDISNYILLIDEPGLYLHPRGQKDVLDEIENLSQENQIIYTTHQTFLINKNKSERVHVIKRETERRGQLAANPFYASRVTDVLNPKSILTDKLLREALGFKVSDISPINEKNILVEGVFDRDILHLVNEKYQIVDLNETSIISCGRASDVSKHAALYKGNDLKVVCLYDSDTAGKSSCNSNDKVTNNEKRQIRDFARQKENETIEDLLPDKMFSEALAEWMKKWNITSTQPIKRPRMEQIGKHFEEDKKVEMKHSLEDVLLSHTRQEIKASNDFDVFKSILEDLKNRLK